MIYGVSSYSFSQYMRSGKMTQKDTIAKAYEMGFEAIEFAEINNGDMPAEDYARLLREEAERVGITISALVVGADFASRDSAEEIARVKKQIDLAALLGTKYFRHDVMYDYRVCRSFDQALPKIAPAIREVSAYAESLGIRTMSENHGFVCQDSDRVERLVNAVDHPNYGVLVDIGNFLCADENPCAAVSRLAPLAFFVHAKDFRFGHPQNDEEKAQYLETRGMNYIQGTPVGKGEANAEKSLRILKKAGFNGHIDIEYEGREDCIEGIADGLSFLKSLSL